MRSLIKTAGHENIGDGTEVFSCKLLRNDITVREFIEKVEQSMKYSNRPVPENTAVFVEYWGMVYLNIGSINSYVHEAQLRIDGNGPKAAAAYSECEIKGKPSSLPSILDKYGDAKVKGCRWDGGWGRGDYTLLIDPVKEPKKETTNV